ncbi:MAG: TadE family protein [Roseiflexaceae bacterium]
MQQHSKTKGQALVEFALAATLIFFLLAAAVDIGLMFFAVQGLHNASQEGGTYGSRWLTGVGAGTRVLNENEIRDRVRHEAGSRGGIGFVNLLDLNNDGIPDVNPDAPIASCGTSGIVCQINSATGKKVVEDYIQVTMINDVNQNGDPTDDGVAPTYLACPNSSFLTCYIRVSTAFDYKLSFPLSPSFVNRTRQLRSSFVMRLRDSFSQSGVAAQPPVFTPATPTPEVLTITRRSYYWNRDGAGAATLNDKIWLSVNVTLNGTPYNGAAVKVTLSTGGVVTLVQTGGVGVYGTCAAVAVSGSTTPSASVSATSANGTASTQAMGPPSIGVAPVCP